MQQTRRKEVAVLLESCCFQFLYIIDSQSIIGILFLNYFEACFCSCITKHHSYLIDILFAFFSFRSFFFDLYVVFYDCHFLLEVQVLSSSTRKQTTVTRFLFLFFYFHCLFGIFQFFLNSYYCVQQTTTKLIKTNFH